MNCGKDYQKNTWYRRQAVTEIFAFKLQDVNGCHVANIWTKVW